MGLSTPFSELPVLDEAVKVFGLANYHATNDICIICMTYDLRCIVASVLWPDSVLPPTKEGLLRTTDNYDQKKRSSPVPNDENNEKKKTMNEKQKDIVGIQLCILVMHIYLYRVTGHWGIFGIYIYTGQQGVGVFSGYN